ncbi:plant virulence effector HPE1-like domain-containing protein [Rhizobium sp. SG2393]|uniref:plant virulence effector HPE1-like domain-containing protein n=1 Tax=Rhizobium sp. SG2393 TaxID=3276279 RepID=UPI00366D2D51
MRSVLMSALLLGAGPAAASSIELITTGPSSDTAGSVETITCAQCVSLPKKETASAYQVPTVQPGTERREIRTVNGQLKMLRTEAWLGGSPVTFVSALPPDLFRGVDSTTGGSLAAAATTTAGTLVAAGGVDTTAQTASVGATEPGKPVETATAGLTDSGPTTTPEVQSQVFDPSTLELRVN